LHRRGTGGYTSRLESQLRAVMSILLTGAAGFIGLHVAAALCARGET
jgi:hypothetical protein